MIILAEKLHQSTLITLIYRYSYTKQKEKYRSSQKNIIIQSSYHKSSWTAKDLDNFLLFFVCSNYHYFHLSLHVYSPFQNTRDLWSINSWYIRISVSCNISITVRFLKCRHDVYETGLTSRPYTDCIHHDVVQNISFKVSPPRHHTVVSPNKIWSSVQIIESLSRSDETWPDGRTDTVYWMYTFFYFYLPLKKKIPRWWRRWW